MRSPEQLLGLSHDRWRSELHSLRADSVNVHSRTHPEQSLQLVPEDRVRAFQLNYLFFFPLSYHAEQDNVLGL